MQRFLYFILILNNLNAAQVGFNKVGYNIASNALDALTYGAVAIDQNNRIITVGRTEDPIGVIACYKQDGALDTSFNTTGYINQPGIFTCQIYYSVTIDSENRIIAVGKSNTNHGLVARYMPNGTLDQTFNGGVTPGYVINNDATIFETVCIDSQGNIIVAGSVGDFGFVARYLPTGLLDETFNAEGTPGYRDEEHSDTHAVEYTGVTIDSHNRIILVGLSKTAGPIRSSLVVRYTAAGYLDTTFNGVGYRTDQPSGAVWPYYTAVALDSQERIVVVGLTNDNPQVAVVARYLSTGALDATFNRTGLKSEAGSATSATIYNGLTIDQQDRIIAVGNASPGLNLIVRYNIDASFDQTFNKVGYIKHGGPGNITQSNGVVIDQQGKIITVAEVNFNQGCIARYLSNGALDSGSNWNSQNYRESAMINNQPIGILSKER